MENLFCLQPPLLEASEAVPDLSVAAKGLSSDLMIMAFMQEEMLVSSEDVEDQQRAQFQTRSD
jgi:hypothetical protein